MAAIGIASAEPMRQIAAAMAAHTTDPVLLDDTAALADAVLDLQTELCALSQYNISLAFDPGIVAVLDDGSAAEYVLELTNKGSLTTTAVITLTTPPELTITSSPPHLVTLSPGQTITTPTTITPSQRGVFVINAEAMAVEAPAIQRQAQAGLNVVDAYLRVIRVTAVPPFVDTGTSSTNLSVDIANVANVSRDVTARAQILAPTSALSYTADVLLSLLVGDPRSYDLGTVNTSNFALTHRAVHYKIFAQSIIVINSSSNREGFVRASTNYHTLLPEISSVSVPPFMPRARSKIIPYKTNAPLMRLPFNKD